MMDARRLGEDELHFGRVGAANEVGILVGKREALVKATVGAPSFTRDGNDTERTVLQALMRQWHAQTKGPAPRLAGPVNESEAAKDVASLRDILGGNLVKVNHLGASQFSQVSSKRGSKSLWVKDDIIVDEEKPVPVIVGSRYKIDCSAKAKVPAGADPAHANPCKGLINLVPICDDNHLNVERLELPHDGRDVVQPIDAESGNRSDDSRSRHYSTPMIRLFLFRVKQSIWLACECPPDDFRLSGVSSTGLLDETSTSLEPEFAAKASNGDPLAPEHFEVEAGGLAALLRLTMPS